MQFDDSQDWRRMLLVAPEPAIEFVRAQQAALPEDGGEDEAPAPAAPEGIQLSKADVQALIFGS
eukprot:4230475-Prymnesium_polylepis.1